MLLKMNVHSLPRCRSSPLSALGLCLFLLLLSGDAVTTLNVWSIPQAGNYSARSVQSNGLLLVVSQTRWRLLHLPPPSPDKSLHAAAEFPQEKHEEEVLKTQSAQAIFEYRRQINLRNATGQYFS